MGIELKIPEVGESITEVEIGGWLKRKGDQVEKDEPLVTLESEKATVELPAPASGSVGEILKDKGQMAKVGEVIGYLEANGKDGVGPTPKTQSKIKEAQTKPESAQKTGAAQPVIMPAAQRVMAEQGLDPATVKGTGPGGRILKEDVMPKAARPDSRELVPPKSAAPPASPAVEKSGITRNPPAASSADGREEEMIPMSRLRQTVAQRLVEAQQTAALLTTFNEIDMSAVASLRKEYGESFVQKHGVKLGFMSFFVKACVDGLKQCPALNAEVRGTNIVYRNYFDIGVAIGGGKGLVVPVLRSAERLSFAELERAIGDFGRRAKDNKLTVDELRGGTFTISNGGIYGSLLSTPIVNPPQSGILGMHAIQERPVARDGNVVIRPMMYVALTYDHRLVDGREAVTFLKRVKEAIEAPARMLLEV